MREGTLSFICFVDQLISRRSRNIPHHAKTIHSLFSTLKEKHLRPKPFSTTLVLLMENNTYDKQ